MPAGPGVDDKVELRDFFLDGLLDGLLDELAWVEEVARV